ncbi:hypothetical protein CWRG_01154 [Chthonomonas calidirosea]|uniref:CHAD domain-containing protein n=1 Tax=Chthonomonas calidirosea TaxID=454171 RepID=UPI000399CEFD|nr:CHAD domain-containing protein [Chthonomonas calidirosea]CEK15425.1 hypothetical protein CWRG_01154 [Chthonomonas calidirosea]CEK15439.1 hypothetical protein CP488_01170 [Chthonomonas calidirosea]CEK16544.1 hypothetical protein CTKA_01170 [Chthonomonas calidirosea]
MTDNQTHRPRDACTFAAQALAHRLSRMLSYFDGVLNGKDPEAVHQMRVWSRRARVVFELFANCFDEKDFKELSKELRRITRALREARDLDVMLERLQREQESLPTSQRAGIQQLCEQLTQRRAQKQREVAATLTRFEAQRVKERFEKLLAPYGATLKLRTSQKIPKNGHGKGKPTPP